MDLEELRRAKGILTEIDWELTPLEAVEMFDHRARGGHSRLQVRDPAKRYYFFCVDNWGESPTLVLKERSIKHSKVIARLQAPEALLRECVEQNGGRKGLFPLTEALERWLRDALYGRG
ncbi:MAG: DVU0772 family protein [Thermodesulfobacteriota bacterium]